MNYKILGSNHLLRKKQNLFLHNLLLQTTEQFSKLETELNVHSDDDILLSIHFNSPNEYILFLYNILNYLNNITNQFRGGKYRKSQHKKSQHKKSQHKKSQHRKSQHRKSQHGGSVIFFIIICICLFTSAFGQLKMPIEQYKKYIEDIIDLPMGVLHNDAYPGKCLANAVVIGGYYESLNKWANANQQRFVAYIENDQTKHPGLNYNLDVNVVRIQINSAKKEEIKTKILKSVKTLLLPNSATIFVLHLKTKSGAGHAVALSIQTDENNNLLDMEIIDAGTRGRSLDKYTLSPNKISPSLTYGEENDMFIKYFEIKTNINNDKSISFSISYTKAPNLFDFKKHANEMLTYENTLASQLSLGTVTSAERLIYNSLANSLCTIGTNMRFASQNFASFGTLPQISDK